jgi:nucleoid-associated protein YgaU
MKKFSTAALILALGGAASGLAHASEQAAGTTRCAFLPNAPDQHTVVRGDTLWGISGRFLQHPWCWPQVWGMNRDQIRDPHWIYPGQVVYLDRANGRLRLGTPVAESQGTHAGGIPTYRLSPQVRAQASQQAEAVPAIPAGIIEPFLSHPLVVEENALQSAPRIVATQENRVLLGKNDTAYVMGDLKGATAFQVFRPGGALRDPGTGRVLGYEAAYLGTVRLSRAGRAADEAHTFKVDSVKQEIGVGDRMLPVPPALTMNYVPRAPEQAVDARVVSIYGGVSQAGQNQIISINRGKNDGLELGHVLELYRYGGTVADRTETVDRGWFRPRERRMVHLPEQLYGSVFVFRVFDNLSYGLVMEVTQPVQVGDVARSPE